MQRNGNPGASTRLCASRRQPVGASQIETLLSQYVLLERRPPVVGSIHATGTRVCRLAGEPQCSRCKAIPCGRANSERGALGPRKKEPEPPVDAGGTTDQHVAKSRSPDSHQIMPLHLA